MELIALPRTWKTLAATGILGLAPLLSLRSESSADTALGGSVWPTHYLSAGTYWAHVGARPPVTAQGPRSPTLQGLRSAGLAGLDPKVGADTPVGSDPAQLPADLRAQAEPYIARSVNHPDFLVAVFQEGRYAGAGAWDCGYGVSTNGGQSWSRALVPHLVSALDGGPFVAATDPVVALDLEDNVYLNILGLTQVSPNVRSTVVLCKSTDGGATFGAPTIVYATSDPNAFPDKNWLAINTYPNSPTRDRLAATFGYFTSNDFRIASTYSDDGGANWSAMQIISPSQCLGSQPVFLPDGSLAVIYWDAAQNQIELVHSADGGQTFGSPRPVAPATSTSDSVARDIALLPAAATDRQAGVIYVAYKTWLNGPRILFTRSIDQGQTWTTPVVASDNPPGDSVLDPALAVTPDGQHVTICFYDKRNDTGQGTLVDLYLAESFDGGNTWGPNLRLTDVSSDLSLAPLTPEGRMLGDYLGIVSAVNFQTPAVAIWIDTRSGSPDPYTTRIQRTQGTTFETWRTLRFSTNQLSATLSGASGSPAGDGVSNLAKYALGFEPYVPIPGLPLLFRRSLTPSPALSLTYAPLAVLTDIQFSWQASSDLTQWLPVTPDHQGVSPGTMPFLQSVEADFLVRRNQQQFFRLGVQKVRVTP